MASSSFAPSQQAGAAPSASPQNLFIALQIAILRAKMAELGAELHLLLDLVNKAAAHTPHVPSAYEISEARDWMHQVMMYGLKSDGARHDLNNAEYFLDALSFVASHVSARSHATSDEPVLSHVGRVAER